MAQLFANNAQSVLAAGISAAALSLQLAPGTGAKFPNPTGDDFFSLTLFQMAGATEVNYEVVYCTARAGDVCTIARAQEGTTARGYNPADPVSARLTAGAIAAKANTGANTYTGAQSIAELDKGTVATGTVTFTYAGSNVQRLQVGGPLQIALAGFPASGVFGDLLIKLVNGGSAAVTMPTAPAINWQLPAGGYTTNFSTYLTAIGRSALQTAGPDWIYLWTDDAGVTPYGKLV
jgi:hypothetical protein